MTRADKTTHLTDPAEWTLDQIRAGAADEGVKRVGGLPGPRRGGNIVADNLPYEWRAGHLTASYAIEIPAAGLYSISLVPDAHMARGATMAGGRTCYSTEWLPKEALKLVDAAGKVAFKQGPIPVDQLGPPPRVHLEPGRYTVKPSKGFAGTYSVHVRLVAETTQPRRR